MRYFIVNYRTRMVRKGFKMEPQTDEIMTVSKKIKMRDLQTASVILDFRDQRVVQATLEGNTIPKDWDTIVGYYYAHYQSTMERLFLENGHANPYQPPAPPVEPNQDS